MLEELKSFILTVAAVGGPLVALLSAWLGKLWAARILQLERAEHERRLEGLKASLKADTDGRIAALSAQLGLARDLAAGHHKAKVDLYRQALVPFLDLFVQGQYPGSPVLISWPEFERKRLGISADLALFASPEVFAAFEAMYEIASRSVRDQRDATPDEAREAVALGARFLQAARTDAGFADSPLPPELLAYRGPSNGV